jgi:hypothetical protein
MLENLSRQVLVGFWLAGGAVVLASIAATHTQGALSNAPLLLTFWLAPLAVMSLVWRGAPPPIVAELLHAVHNATDSRS